MSGWLLGAAPPPPRIRQELEAVYRRPEFRGPESSGWLHEFLSSIVEWFGALRVAAPPLFWLLLITCVLLLCLLLFWVGWRVRRAFYLGERAGREKADAQRRVRLSADYAAEARRQAERGDFTEAIRCLFLSLIYHFDESGRVGLQRAYTNHEYLELVAAQPEVRDGLRLFVDTLDEHWYGQRPAGRDQYQDCLALYERIR
jgi:hypothetical protein